MLCVVISSFFPKLETNIFCSLFNSSLLQKFFLSLLVAGINYRTHCRFHFFSVIFWATLLIVCVFKHDHLLAKESVFCREIFYNDYHDYIICHYYNNNSNCTSLAFWSKYYIVLEMAPYRPGSDADYRRCICPCWLLLTIISSWIL